MTRRVSVIGECDIDGNEFDGDVVPPVEFEWGGVRYEIDLCNDVDHFDETAINTLIENARRVKSNGKSKAKTKPKKKTEAPVTKDKAAQFEEAWSSGSVFEHTKNKSGADVFTCRQHGTKHPSIRGAKIHFFNQH